MAKPDPILLDLEKYPVVCEIGTRFRDSDRYDHVNNNALGEMFETARVRLDHALDMRNIVGPDPAVVVVSATFDYLSEATFPSPIKVGTAVTHIGQSSWTVMQLAFQKGIARATCRCTLVHSHRGKAMPIAEAWRVQLQSRSFHTAPKERSE